MSNTRRIRQTRTRTRTGDGMHVETFTSGHEGDGFNVSISSPATSRKQRATLELSLDDNTTVRLSGQQIQTLRRIITRHYRVFNRNNNS